MNIPLNIETHDWTLGFDIAAIGTTLRSGTVVDVPGGAKLLYQGTLARRAVGIPEVLQFVVDASVNVDLALLAAWLYDKLKSKTVARVIINQTVITEITEDRIRQVLIEEVRSRE